jgi:hypothetical protein
VGRVSELWEAGEEEKGSDAVAVEKGGVLDALQ